MSAADYYGKWKGTVWCVASGPSLTADDIEKLRGQRVICVNTTVRLAPWSDAMYAGDSTWWRANKNDWQNHQGLKFTINRSAAQEFNLIHVPFRNDPGLGKEILHGGSNSGYQAVNLAYLLGAERICLLGYDMQPTYGETHWHGDHEKTTNPHSGSYKNWRDKFARLHQDLVTEGIPLINCTRETALKVPRMDLDECLRER